MYWRLKLSFSWLVFNLWTVNAWRFQVIYYVTIYQSCVGVCGWTSKKESTLTCCSLPLLLKPRLSFCLPRHGQVGVMCVEYLRCPARPANVGRSMWGTKPDMLFTQSYTLTYLSSRSQLDYMTWYFDRYAREDYFVICLMHDNDNLRRYV